ncbi:MAG: FHA domain-containing protein, partial [candidate division KSB1 bacterium]
MSNTQTTPSSVKVKIEQGETLKTDFEFGNTFRIGRDPKCHVRIDDYALSRVHAEVALEEGYWCIRDLHSTNGVFLNGMRIEHAILTEHTRITLGKNGPALMLTIPGQVPPQPQTLATAVLAEYLLRSYQKTRVAAASLPRIKLRRSLRRMHTPHARGYLAVIALVSILFVGAAWYAKQKHDELGQQHALAKDIFYEMKELELTLASLERVVQKTGETEAIAEIARQQTRRKELARKYERFVGEAGLAKIDLEEEERVILRIARLLGECEVDMPPGFVREVRHYVAKWRSTGRLRAALERAQQNEYTTKISEALIANDLPPQFFYIALQESNFDLSSCGPVTRHGIAKGMWQFIPTTAEQYGLRIGPLVHYRRPDPRDERHDFEKSTLAAAKYLKTIYETEAKASGLLVIASYNWGENNVRELIQKMPDNPRERNFWHLLQNHRAAIPQETYDYVFYIISAAVIGEN